MYIKKRTSHKHQSLDIQHDVRLTRTIGGKYWLLIPMSFPIAPFSSRPSHICGIDPGVRTFMTVSGSHGLEEYSNRRDQLDQLNKKMDLLQSKSKKPKYIRRIYRRKQNIINDLHWQTIGKLLSRYDLLFYGDIKSHDIVSRKKIVK